MVDQRSYGSRDTVLSVAVGHMKTKPCALTSRLLRVSENMFPRSRFLAAFIFVWRSFHDNVVLTLAHFSEILPVVTKQAISRTKKPFDETTQTSTS